jgi:hypothetical protein
METVASRHSLLPRKNGPLLYVNLNNSEEEKVRLGEDEMGWCRKDKFQQFPSTVHAPRLAYPVPAFSRTNRADENKRKGALPSTAFTEGVSVTRK